MRLLTLIIQEPLPDRVLPLMAADFGHEEAARRYRAIVLTMLRQLRGLHKTRVRILPYPRDASDALRFWLLPRLADHWEVRDQSVFHNDGWEIDFGGTLEAFQITATGEVLCPFLGARWVHTAMLGLERGTHQVVGPACGGGQYFHAAPVNAQHPLEVRTLPELPVIQTANQWDEARESALGPALKRAWDAEA